MRLTKPVKRASALLLTAAIGTLGPGLAPLPAFAQETSTADDGYFATPPPVDPGQLPTDDGQPNETYTKGVQCVQGDFEKNIKLKQAPWGQQYLRLEEVHQLMNSTLGSAGKRADGTPIRIGVIDTGVRPDHPYFQGRVKEGADYVKHVSPGLGLEDCDGHGTEVAGIIAANVTDNDIAFQGVAPDAEIVSIRQSSQNYEPADEPAQSSAASPPPGGDSGQPPEEGQDNPGGDSGGPSGQGRTSTSQDNGGRTQEQEGTAGTLDTLAEAVVHATAAGLDVVNISINNCRPADGGITTGERKLQAAVHNAVENNVVVVTAAGNTDGCEQNDQQDPDKPKTIVTPPWFSDDVLSVAAIDETGGVADFSVHGPWVSVAAPGTKITSLDPAPGSPGLANLTIENGESQLINGTSFAAPYVTGLVALVRAKYPDLDARQVMNRITSTAQHPAAPGGRDNFVGYGVIDPMAALTAIVPEEAGLSSASAVALPSDLPPADDRNPTPVIVALAGSGGALMALLIALFVVHTIRRNRPAEDR